MPQRPNLIFLISQPRSGSTLLQRILGNHPDIHTLSEPWIMFPPLYALKPHGYEAEGNSREALRALRDFLNSIPEGEEAYLEGARRMYSYLYERSAESAGKKFFLDKTPLYSLILPELVRVFPDAHYLILLRNPLAVFSSVLESWVGDHPIRLAFSRRGLLKAPAQLVEAIESIPQARVVHYEQLVSEPRRIIQEITDWLGVRFVSDIIEYGNFQGSRWRLGDKKVYRYHEPVTDHIGRWEQVLSQKRVWGAWAKSYLEALGASVIERMGYDYRELEERLHHLLRKERKLRHLPPWSFYYKCPLFYRGADWALAWAMEYALKLKGSLRERGLCETVLFSWRRFWDKVSARVKIDLWPRES